MQTVSSSIVGASVGRDVLVALVQGALKDVPRDTVAKWIETTFRPYADQLKQYGEYTFPRFIEPYRDAG
jgi:hypothetical protein